jgi:hypothetical protein
MMSKRSPTKQIEPIDLDHVDRNRIAALVDLFNAIDVTEKGIEIVYDYLLRHEHIDEPKMVFENLGLAIKRVYKILAVLKELGLIQVYDRPMKIYRTDVKRAWQNLLSEKFKIMRESLNEKIQQCEKTFSQMMDVYQLPTEDHAPPVEFISYDSNDNPLEYLQNLFANSTQCLITKEMRNNSKVTDDMLAILRNPENHNYKSPTELSKLLSQLFGKVQFQALLNEDLCNEIGDFLVTMQDEYTAIESLAIVPENVQLRITSQSVGNFIIKDHQELLQMSFAPNKVLVGIFVSRQNEIIDIFAQKFTGIYTNATDFDSYFKNRYKRPASLLEKFIFLLL